MTGIRFETVVRKDIRKIGPLWEKLNKIHYCNSKDFKKKYRHFKFEDRIGMLFEKVRGDLLLVLAAVDGNGDKTIGYCISSVDYLGGGEIDSIFVEKEYRKKGVGEELMKRSLAWLKKQKSKHVQIAVAAGNEDVFGFYGKFGFAPGKTILEMKKSR